MPVIGFLHGALPWTYTSMITAFRQGLKEAGYVEGHNVAIEYRTIGCRRWQPISFADKWPRSSRSAPLRHLLPRRRLRQFELSSSSA